MTPEEKRKLVLEFMRDSAKKGGLARGKSTSKARLTEIAKIGAQARWAQRPKKS